MEILLLIARLVLALVFGVAGIAKLADPAGSRRAMADFGMPEWLSGALSRSLPAIEIILALALIPLSTAWWAAVAATGLLLLFATVIGANLARGNAPDCHCFGQLHSQPASWSVCLRNVTLAAVGGFIVVRGKESPGLSALAWLGDLKAVEVVNLILAVSGIAILITALIFLRKTFRLQATMIEKLEAIKKVVDDDYAEPAPVERKGITAPEEGLPVGAPAPEFSLPSLAGGHTSLAELLEAGKPVLLLFVSTSCYPCKTLLPMVKAWERDYGDYLTFAILSKGSLKHNQSHLSKYEASHMLAQEDSKVVEAYEANWTPAAYLISREGKIASRMANGEDAVRALVNHTVTTGAEVAKQKGVNGHIPQITVGNSLFKIGEPAPRFSLPDAQGREVRLESLLGTETLLIFWDTQCQYCQAMAEDIKRWEARPPNGAPSLVFIVSGKTDAGLPEFRSLILLDPDFDIAPLFGSINTPSAVLIDGSGRIASSLARGSEKVLALTGLRRVELPIASVH